MTDFIALSPHVVICGATFVAMVQTLGEIGISKEEGEAWLSAHGLLPLHPEAWYPWQAYLDFYRWVEELKGPEGLRKFGRAIPRSAKFPPEVKTLDRALKTLDIAYGMNHRGGEIGGYYVERVSTNQLHLHCDNPYGCEFDMGIIEGLVALFAAPGSHPTLEHAPNSPCRTKGGRLCIYEITLNPQT